MNITPKIDYALLGEAVEYYMRRGYRYVEVPWFVEPRFVAATLPDSMSRHVIAEQSVNAPLSQIKPLVGSAEQGFLAINNKLVPGRYVGVTPCFRIEKKHDLFYQATFMKVELYSNTSEFDDDLMLRDASDFMRGRGAMVDVRETDIGRDLYIDDVEVGSYGRRSALGIDWSYGTGLALPRFSVAYALQKLNG